MVLALPLPQGQKLERFIVSNLLHHATLYYESFISKNVEADVSQNLKYILRTSPPPPQPQAVRLLRTSQLPLCSIYFIKLNLVRVGWLNIVYAARNAGAV